MLAQAAISSEEAEHTPLAAQMRAVQGLCWAIQDILCTHVCLRLADRQNFQVGNFSLECHALPRTGHRMAGTIGKHGWDADTCHTLPFYFTGHCTYPEKGLWHGWPFDSSVKADSFLPCIEDSTWLQINILCFCGLTGHAWLRFNLSGTSGQALPAVNMCAACYSF